MTAMSSNALAQRRAEPPPRVTQWRWSGVAFQIIWAIFVATIFTRASLDRLFESVPIGSFTLGVFVNVLIVSAGFLAIVTLPGRLTGLIAFIWAPYALWMFICIFTAPDLMGAVRFYVVLISYPAIFAMGIAAASFFGRIETILNLVMLSLIGPLIGALYQYFTVSEERIAGAFGHPNILASYLLCVLPVSGIVLYRQFFTMGPIRRVAIILAILVAGGLLLATQTRSAWAAAALIFVIFGIIVDRRALLLLPLVSLVIFLPQVQKRLDDVQKLTEVPDYMVTGGFVTLDSYSWRKALWRDAIKDVEKNQVTGMGLGSFRVNSNRFFPIAPGYDAHSAFVQTYYEGGWIGLLCYLWVPFSMLLLRYMRAGPTAAFLTVAILVSYLTVSYSDNILYYLSYNWYVWGILGAILGASWRRLNSLEKAALHSRPARTKAVQPLMPPA